MGSRMKHIQHTCVNMSLTFETLHFKPSYCKMSVTLPNVLIQNLSNHFTSECEQHGVYNHWTEFRVDKYDHGML